jgi:hypothetical protein
MRRIKRVMDAMSGEPHVEKFLQLATGVEFGVPVAVPPACSQF